MAMRVRLLTLFTAASVTRASWEAKYSTGGGTAIRTGEPDEGGRALLADARKRAPLGN